MSNRSKEPGKLIKKLPKVQSPVKLKQAASVAHMNSIEMTSNQSVSIASNGRVTSAFHANNSVKKLAQKINNAANNGFE